MQMRLWQLAVTAQSCQGQCSGQDFGPLLLCTGWKGASYSSWPVLTLVKGLL